MEESNVKQEEFRDEKGRFKPGYSGNLAGRPKNEDSPTYWLKKFLSEIDPKTVDGKRRIEQIAERLAVEAFKGESWAMKEVFDRLDGKAPHTIKHSGEIQTGASEVAQALRDILNEEDTDDIEKEEGNSKDS